MSEPAGLDRERLLSAAEEARGAAYAPYSRYRVGAALLAASGRVYRGCNVENASFSLTVCAERNAMAAAVLAGERAFAALAVATDPAGPPVAPCGACRQALGEFGLDLLVVLGGPGGPSSTPLRELLPRPFGPTDLWQGGPA